MNFNMPTIPDMSNFKPAQVAIAESNYASEFAKYILEQIIEFDSNLGEDLEVGLKLVNFGQTVTFPVRAIDFKNPSLIIFYGIAEDGSEIELIQHVSQISFLITSIPRENPQLPKQKIGFSV